MSFWPTGSAHSFAVDDLVVDVDGIRGTVSSATALYAVVQWEDGREEEIEQGDPRVTSEGPWQGDDEAGEWEDDEGADVVTSFDLWFTAGPKPEEAPAVETPSTLPLPEAA